MEIEIQKVYERKIVTLFFFVWGLSFFSRLSINFAMPIITEKLTLTPSQIGTITFVSTIAIAISSIIVSRIADRKGKYKIFLVFSLMTIGVFSLVTPLINSYIEFIILRFIVGLGVGPILPIMMSICERSSSHNSFGKNTGLILAGDAIIASILGPIIITQLTKVVSWQVALAIASIPTIIVGLICIKVIKENLASDKGVLKEVIEQPEQQHKVSDMFKFPNIFVSMLLAILTLGGFFTISIYAPVYLTEVKGYNESTMGVIVALNGIMYLPYALIISRLTDKFGYTGSMLGASILFGVALILALFLKESNKNIIKNN